MIFPTVELEILLHSPAITCDVAAARIVVHAVPKFFIDARWQAASIQINIIYAHLYL